MPRKVTIVNVGYRSTNFWIVSAAHSRLLVDLGWPGKAATLFANIERMGIPLAEISHGLATHYHIDHAGAAQDLKQRGMRLIVMPSQVQAITPMRQWVKPQDGYTVIAEDDNLVLSFEASRDFLGALGIDGEIIATPGHSEDSVSLVLDDGSAFVGDLTPEWMVAAEDPAVVAASWNALRGRGVHTIYGGHVPPYPIPAPYFGG